jgi:hypothetical protein
MSKLGAILGAAICAAAGFLTGRAVAPTEIIFHRTAQASPEPAGERSFSCLSSAQSSVWEDVSTNTVRASAARGTEKLAVKIDAPGHAVRFLTSAAIDVGIIDASPMTIVSDTARYLVATDHEDGHILHAFLFDKDQHTAVWTKTNATPDSGMIAFSMFLECR